MPLNQRKHLLKKDRSPTKALEYYNIHITFLLRAKQFYHQVTLDVRLNQRIQTLKDFN